jgi:hypothetical protein
VARGEFEKLERLGSAGRGDVVDPADKGFSDASRQAMWAE